MTKYNVGLKTFLLQGLSEPELLVKKIFLVISKKIIVLHTKIGYNIRCFAKDGMPGC